MTMDFKKFYNEHSEYEELRNNQEKIKENEIVTNYKCKTLCKVIPKELSFENVLEIGCSNGLLLHKMSESLSIKKIYGVDISSKNIEYAKEKYPSINFYFGFLEDFILENKVIFDLVILSDIVEHVENDFDFLNKISKISKYVVLNLPLEKSFHNRNRNYGPNDVSGHLRWYNSSDAKKLVKSTGYEIIKQELIIDIKEDKDWFNYNLLKRKQALSQKKFIKKIKWQLFFISIDFILFYIPSIYVKIYGCNYFAFLKSKN